MINQNFNYRGVDYVLTSSTDTWIVESTEMPVFKETDKYKDMAIIKARARIDMFHNKHNGV